MGREWFNRSMADNSSKSLETSVQSVLDKALTVQQPLAEEYVARLRRVHPDKSPEELIAFVNKWYLGAVSTTGAGAGVAAIVPNIAVQVPAALADMATFLEASVMYVLSLMEIYGLNVEDIERRKLLVTTVLVGDAGTKVLDKVLGRTVPYWGKQIVKSIPMKAINQANKILGPRFITKWGTKQGILVLGKQLPLAMGAAIGGVGNGAFGYGIIRSCKKTLGPAPTLWVDIDGDGQPDIEIDIVEEDLDIFVDEGSVDDHRDAAGRVVDDEL